MPYPDFTKVAAGTLSGFQDWNDTATATTPIALSGTPAELTNDGLGTFTNTAYAVNGHGNIWDASTNRFDFSSLKLGDSVDIRPDVTVTTTGPNRNISMSIELAIGGSAYTLNIDERAFKTAGVHQIVRWYGIYMGDNNTRNNPARLTMTSDGTGDSVVVNGWYVRTTVR